MNKKLFNALKALIVDGTFKEKPNMLCMWTNCLQPVVEIKTNVYYCKRCAIHYVSRAYGGSTDNEGLPW